MFAAGYELDEVLRSHGQGVTNPVGMLVAMITNDVETRATVLHGPDSGLGDDDLVVLVYGNDHQAGRSPRRNVPSAMAVLSAYCAA